MKNGWSSLAASANSIPFMKTCGVNQSSSRLRPIVFA